MKTQIEKELEERYLKEVSKIWDNDKGMIDYFIRKNELYISILNNKGIIALEKPRIEKNFYFAEHGYDFEQVCKHEREVNKDIESFFIDENLKEINKKIEDLIKYPNKAAVIQLYNNSCIYEYHQFVGHNDKIILLNEEDRENLLKGLEYQKTTFEKRLRSYLKKYGTSKISTSTFWADK